MNRYVRRKEWVHATAARCGVTHRAIYWWFKHHDVGLRVVRKNARVIWVMEENVC